MPVLGIALAFAGYGLLIQGYAWVRRYTLTPAEVWSPTRYYTGAWPPELAQDSAVGGALSSTTTAVGGALPPTAVGGGLSPKIVGGGLNQN